MTYWDMFNKATKFKFSWQKIERICMDIDSIIHLHQQDQDLVPPGSVTNRTLNSQLEEVVLQPRRRREA